MVISWAVVANSKTRTIAAATTTTAEEKVTKMNILRIVAS